MSFVEHRWPIWNHIGQFPFQHAPFSAQPERKPLRRFGRWIEFFLVNAGKISALNLSNVLRGVADILPPVTSNRRVGAWAKAKIIFAVPIREVVSALVTREGEVRDFVLV